MINIALAGNPNCGKTSLFNSLTGLRQHVGNWPGKTVDKKEGKLTYKGNNINIVDLPGIYSLSAYSMEELIARDFIIDEKPDVVLNVVDATNLERNLYLTIQLIEMGANVIVALNMNKYAKEKGHKISHKVLSKLLGVPVVKIEAVEKISKSDLLDLILLDSRKKTKNKISYGFEFDKHILDLEEDLKKINIDNPKWIAIKLLEKDKKVKVNNQKIVEKSRKIRNHLKEGLGQGVIASLAEARYAFISGLLNESLEKTKIDRKTKSDIADRIITNKYLGVPIFLISMLIMFFLVFEFSLPLMDLIDKGFGLLGNYVITYFGESWVSSLVGDGIIGGIGAVLVFVPPIFLLFFALSILGDCGYMARIAYVMDRFMHRIGLHGKSFIPMVMGFGCNVPAIMATRTLESRRDRILTMMINPFMSCSARLPVYVFFAGAFFSAYQGLVVFSLYLLGIVVAVVLGLIFRKTMFKGPSAPFVMELPPYRIPTLKGALIHMWENGSQFLKKAGTIIFVAVIIIWSLSSLPLGVEYASQESYIGQIGSFISPVFGPLGFGNWQTSVALLSGLVAKEVIVGTFGTLFGGEETVIDSLHETFTPLSAYAFLVFVLLYIPCFGVIAVIKKETQSWRWPIFISVYTVIVAWIVSFIVYQGGIYLGFS
ncbi:ferrous iron transport protein B [Nanoarchaeota archaeon]